MALVGGIRKAKPIVRNPMRIALKVLGIVLVLMGGVWILQGINVLPGSFMTGQTKWTIYGVVAVIVGATLLVASTRRRSVQ